VFMRKNLKAIPTEPAKEIDSQGDHFAGSL
jgi:hypothetical protein